MAIRSSMIADSRMIAVTSHIASADT
jgi:hypothetical protein